jgi:CubicO group peptidase (beta-lactamase class C family)
LRSERPNVTIERMEVPISGRCDSRFAGVQVEFARNFAERGEVGAGVSVVVDGTLVVDLVGGWADRDRRLPWRDETLVDMYSAGKPFVALLALRQVDAGRLELDAPITSVWPEFARAGKEAATVRQALCHRAGVPAIRTPLTNDDLWRWDTMVGALAATEPWWEPGTRHAYHTNTYGHLVGELARRTGDGSCGQQLAALVRPLDADVHFGVPTGDLNRCAEVLFSSSRTGTEPDLSTLEGDALMEMTSYFNPPGYSSFGVVNTAPWRRSEVPSTNGHATAKGIARLYAALLEPGHLLSSDLLSEATSPQSEGYCPILHDEVSFGLGFKPTTPRRPFGPNPGSFGHFGTGGAVGFADPVAGVAFGYVMNDVIPRWQSSRNRALIDSVYASI